MRQQNFDFFFSRPTIYFGSFQHIEDCDPNLEWEEITPFVLEINSQFFRESKIGLFLHWMH